MHITLTAPSELRLSVSLPSSKSISNRAQLIAALCGSGAEKRLANLSDCDDTRVMQLALKDMAPIIDIGAAGTAMRFLSAFLAVTEGAHTITGTERMRHRPIGILVEALRSLGASVKYAGEEGFPPLHIEGRRLRGGRVEMAGNVSSQYVSALLMVGPTMEEGLTLALQGEVVSRPYIEMTLALMRTFGAEVAWTDERTIRVAAGGYRPTDFRVESDWSAASYWYEMAALTDNTRTEIRLPGLFRESLQGDSAVREMFRHLGVETEFGDEDGTETVRLTKNGQRAARIELNFTHQPDLAQTLVVSCALAGIPFRFTGLQSLKIKETDRMAALQTEMRKLGYVVGEQDDSVLFWNGERCTPQEIPAIDTYEDHRMAMAFAPAALVFGPLRINNPEVVSKSYPQYWSHLKAAGFDVCSTQ